MSEIESRKERILYLLKFFAKKHKQKTSYSLEVFSNKMANQKTVYIHKNPVKATIVNEPNEYFYNSANPFSKVLNEVI